MQLRSTPTNRPCHPEGEPRAWSCVCLAFIPPPVLLLLDPHFACLDFSYCFGEDMPSVISTLIFSHFGYKVSYEYFAVFEIFPKKPLKTALGVNCHIQSLLIIFAAFEGANYFIVDKPQCRSDSEDIGNLSNDYPVNRCTKMTTFWRFKMIVISVGESLEQTLSHFIVR